MATKTKKRSVSSVVSVSSEKVVPSKPSSRSSVVEFNPDYSYVKKDLARIGILAASFFVILVVLSFFLR
ncbi:MAG: hypothetical protein NTZ74_16275 [Chloroflexi bacterium]|nr:hypothetical protein [Chloroflexota bacterium]